MYIACGDSALDAFDKLFKIFFIFNLNYPDVLKSFYLFVEQFVYKLPTNTTRLSGVLSFAAAFNKQLEILDNVK